MGCNCCEQPPCPAPVLECDAISQSKSKFGPCGYLNPADGKYYSKKTETGTASTHFEDGAGSPPSDWWSIVRDASCTITRVYEKGGLPCAETVTVTGSSSYTYVESSYSALDDNEFVTTTICETTLAGGVWTGTIRTIHTESAFPENNFDVTVPNGFICNELDASIDFETTYENEVSAETTAELITRTVAALPAYPGTYSGSCSAYRNLSTDETSYSIRRTKWRVSHEPTGTCYLKVWLQARFTPEGGGSDTITPLTPYEWSGSGNPCFVDPMLPPDDPDNRITSSPTEEVEPATDGTTVIEIVKWSCLDGYTPPDDGTANGFPIAA